MDKHEILRIIARQLLNQRNHLDALAETSDWTESAKDAYDNVVTGQRTRELQEIADLRDAKEEDIVWILDELGPYLAMEYLQVRAGCEELGGHRSFYAASLKFGFPDLSWEEVREQAKAAPPLQLKNPQMALFEGWQKAFHTPLSSWKRQGADCDAIPYLSDRFYMNGVIRDLPQGDPLEREDNSGLADTLRLSKVLFAAAFSGWEKIKDQPHLVDDDLRLCALVTFACQELPGYNSFEDMWHSGEPAPVLRHLDKAIAKLGQASAFFHASTSCSAERKEIFAAFDAGQIADVRGLRDRIELCAASELFTNPVTYAQRLYDHLETEKLTRLAAVAIEPKQGSDFKGLDCHY